MLQGHGEIEQRTGRSNIPRTLRGEDRLGYFSCRRGGKTGRGRITPKKRTLRFAAGKERGDSEVLPVWKPDKPEEGNSQREETLWQKKEPFGSFHSDP